MSQLAQNFGNNWPAVAMIDNIRLNPNLVTAPVNDSLPLRPGFHRDGNGPGKAEQFTGNGGQDVWFVLTGGGEFLIAALGPAPFSTAP